eukprot:CAMPEP_0174698164 /NCGR_PEP_ID=MMETSP1094-20130205/3818_1 /TAXON_ID=156173 /ORGANISM="Chrysochromulina brevifilum, Strain UTEX LB 985" /LENGTH=197 /DNA_ID=CAMNT_0015895275 /DNA_START=4 /DNA_END=598 /DNA_ORIENTATION=-
MTKPLPMLLRARSRRGRGKRNEVQPRTDKRPLGRLLNWLHSRRAAVSLALILAACALPPTAGPVRTLLRTVGETLRLVPAAVTTSAGEQANSASVATVWPELGPVGLTMSAVALAAALIRLRPSDLRAGVRSMEVLTPAAPSAAKAWPWAKALGQARKAPRSLRSILLHDQIVADLRHDSRHSGESAIAKEMREPKG